MILILLCSNCRKHYNVRIARHVIISWVILLMERTRRRNRKSILAWNPSAWEWLSKRSVGSARPNLPYSRSEIISKSHFKCFSDFWLRKLREILFAKTWVISISCSLVFWQTMLSHCFKVILQWRRHIFLVCKYLRIYTLML